MTFTPKLCGEKKMATSGDNSDFASSSGGTSGYIEGESHFLTVSVTSLVICCTVVLKGL